MCSDPAPSRLIWPKSLPDPPREARDRPRRAPAGGSILVKLNPRVIGRGDPLRGQPEHRGKGWGWRGSCRLARFPGLTHPGCAGCSDRNDCTEDEASKHVTIVAYHSLVVRQENANVRDVPIV